MSESESPKQPRRRSIIRRDTFLAERYARNTKCFTQVFECYTEFCGTAPIGAANHDPLARRNGLNFSHIEFICDVDRCVVSTLKTTDVQLFRLLIQIELRCTDADKQAAKNKAGISPHVESRIIQSLGAAFHKRALTPAAYFSNTRKRRLEEEQDHPVHPAPSKPTKPRSEARDDFDSFEGGYGFGLVDNTEAAA